jgi:hypothetical protein
MILSYSKDRFVHSIKSGRKKHTIRADPKKRWKVGMKIQHWRGNPRNVKQKPYQFGEGECKGIQEIRIYMYWDLCFCVEVDGRDMSQAEIEALAANDDLTVEEFEKWFMPDGQEFTGRIIHYTDLKY